MRIPEPPPKLIQVLVALVWFLFIAHAVHLALTGEW